MASLTINTDAAQDAILGPVYGRKFGLRNAAGQARSATTAEVKAYLINVMRQDVQADQQQAATLAFVPTAFDPT